MNLPLLQPLGSQRAAYEMLREFADLFFSGEWKSLPLVPRLKPLLVGPSGVGKTWLVRHLALELKLPIEHLHVGDWLPSGARTQTHTLTQLREWVELHERGVLYIDELDKFGGRQSDWAVCTVQELYALLDGRVRMTHGRPWSSELVAKLRDSFWIVGSGTWQGLWDAEPLFGFAPRKAVSIAERLERQQAIPEELRRRFNGRPVVLSYPTAADIAQVVEDLRPCLDPGLLAGIEERAVEIVASRKGMRWFEEHLADALLERRRQKLKKNEDINF